MLVSVIIPVYKPDNSFNICFNSLQKQTLNKDSYEVIIILNGPKENYEQNIQNLIAESDMMVKYRYEEVGNVSNARNIGIMMADGKYITFVDADDWISQDYLKLLLDCSEAGYMPLAYLSCFNEKDNCFYNDYLGNLYNMRQIGKEYNHFSVKSYFSVPVAKLIPAEIAKKKSFHLDLSSGEDALYMFEIEPFIPRCKFVSKNACYFRRVTTGSLSRRKLTKKENVILHKKLIKKYISVYFRNFLIYNPLFFIVRLLAVVKHLLK